MDCFDELIGFIAMDFFVIFIIYKSVVISTVCFILY